MSKPLIRQSAKNEAYEAWGRILKLAHDLERVESGAGEMFLRRMARTLDQIRTRQLSGLSASASRDD